MVYPESNNRPRVAVITGCGRSTGIGAAAARVFASQGMRVAISDIESNYEDLIHVADEINHSLGSTVGEQLVRAFVCDVTSESSCIDVADRVADIFGGIDILVNNAGSAQGDDRGDLSRVAIDACSSVVDVNFTGTLRMIKAALPHLRRSGAGRIVNIASLAAIRSHFDRVAYAGSKAGVLGISVSLSGDLAQDGITVNAICPGSIDTGREAVRVDGSVDGSGHLAPVYDWTPVGRFGTAADVAAAVKFFASEDTDFITGQTLAVDGGLSAVLRR